MNQRVASLEHDTRQHRLAMVADGQANTKTRERTEGAAQAIQAMDGYSVTPTRVDPGPKTNSASFGVKAESSALPRRKDVLVENSAAAPKSCLPFLEMRKATTAGDLLYTGEISTATKTTFNKSPLRLYSTGETNSKETNSWTSVPPAWYDISLRKLHAVSSCRRAIEAKSIQNRTFDPSGSRDRLRVCQFLGTWRALLCGEVMRVDVAGDELQRVLGN